MKLPKNISNKYLILSEELSGQSSSRKGIYLDVKSDKKVFIKIDSNKKKLQKEFVNQKFFHQFSDAKKDIVVPSPIEIVKALDYSAFITEFVSGNTIDKLSIKNRVDVYTRILEFISSINQASNKNQVVLNTKSAGKQLVALPYFLLKNIYLYSAYWYLFLNSAIHLIKNAPKLSRFSSNWINHGDINVNNLLISGKTIVLLDFADICLSHKYLDISIALNSTWYQPGFHDELWNKIVSDFNFNPEQREILRSFVMFNLMQRLSKRYKNIGQEQFYIKKLRNTLKSYDNNKNKLLWIMNNHGYKPVDKILIDDSSRFNGIVTDGIGEKYFVKAVFGKKGYAFKSLERESNITNYLSLKTEKNSIDLDGFKLIVPRVKEIIKGDGYLFLITEYIEGKSLLKFSSSNQAKILLATAELVNKLGHKVNVKDIAHYSKNYKKNAIVFYLPIRFAKAVVLSPSAVIGLIRISLKSILLIFTNYRIGLVHPDINSSNIIIRNKKIYLTDWEEAGWGISPYNIITPLCVHWQNTELREALIEKSVSIPLLAYRTLMLFNQRMGKAKRNREQILLKYLGSK